VKKKWKRLPKKLTTLFNIFEFSTRTSVSREVLHLDLCRAPYQSLNRKDANFLFLYYNGKALVLMRERPDYTWKIACSFVDDDYCHAYKRVRMVITDITCVLKEYNRRRWDYAELALNPASIACIVYCNCCQRLALSFQRIPYVIVNEINATTYKACLWVYCLPSVQHGSSSRYLIKNKTNTWLTRKSLLLKLALTLNHIL